MTLNWKLISLLSALSIGCADSETSDPAPGDTPAEESGDIAPLERNEDTTQEAEDDEDEDVSVESGADTTSAEDAEADGATTLETDAIPLALVYENNPLDEETVEVELLHLTDPQGYLTGKYTKVWNCTQEPGGETVNIGFGELTLCNQKQQAQPENGSYTHIQPAEWTDGSDSFAEIMMYYHVNLIHDYFQNVHGLNNLDFPLTAIVNVQANTPFLGGWFPFDNAAFIPEESFDAFPFPLEVGPGGAIIFGQGEKVDYAYEVDVIYHEYTHAMVGTTRLTGFVRDEFGPDNTPGAMNEGFADYFATTITEDPVLGEYALGNIGGGNGAPPQDLRRDLSQFHGCPADLTTEVHADGLIIGSALWEMRSTLGPEVSDALILNALGTFSEDTNFTSASEAIIAEAEGVDEATGQTVRTIFEERGLLGCDRVMDYDGPIVKTGGADSLPFTIPGTQETDLIPFSSYVPSFQQWRIPVTPETRVMTVELTGQAGGGLGGFGFGGPQENPSIALAVKFADEPVLYTYKGAKPAEHDADAVLPMEDSASSQGLLTYLVEVELPCDGEATAVHLQFHTTSGAGLAGLGLEVTETTVETCGGAEENEEESSDGTDETPEVETEEESVEDSSDSEEESTDEEGGTP